MFCFVVLCIIYMFWTSRKALHAPLGSLNSIGGITTEIFFATIYVSMVWW
jgi:hypothetical protein